METSGLAPEQAFLVAVLIEGIFYGLLVALFSQSLFVLLQGRRPNQRLNKSMLIAVIVMFTISTAHLSVNLYRLMQAFVFSRESPGGPAGYLGNVSDPFHVTQVVFFGVQSLIGDMLNIFRCFVVWHRNWRVVVVPFILLAISCGAGLIVIYQYTQAPPGVTLFDNSLSHWIIVFYSVAPAQNVLTTSFIAYRIWSVERATAQRFRLLPVFLVLVESAAFYSMAELLLITLYIMGTTIQFIVLESITPIVGIVFTLIIIRVAVQASQQTVSSPSIGIAFVRSPEESERALSMEPVAIRVSQAITQDDIDDGLEKPVHLTYPYAE